MDTNKSLKKNIGIRVWVLSVILVSFVYAINLLMSGYLDATDSDRS